ncbi:MAG: nitroreductase family protein [Dehalococcoidia bacterium]|nr:nitroreductase family protein [Dehalococcoidia bacterium]
MTLEELGNLIKARRSVRKFEDKPVPEDLLMKAVELATWAPNSGGQQNWRFYIILNKDTIKAIADAVQATADKVAAYPEAERYGEEAARFRRSASFFRSAPAAIAVAVGQYRIATDHILEARAKIDPEAAKIRDWRATSASRIQTAGAATATLLLVLQQMGLGATYMSGPMQAKGHIEKILKVPPEMDLVTFVPVGYPAEAPVKTRKPLSEVCEVIR